MWAEVTTRRGITVPLSLEAEPQVTYADGVGMAEAIVPAYVPDELLDDARLSTLRIHGDGPVFEGLVWDAPRPGHPLRALGQGVAATLGRHDLLYCHTALSGWREREASTRDTRIAVSQNGLGWSFKWETGHTFAENRHNGIWLSIPETSGCRLEFDYIRPSQAGYQYLVFAGVENPGGLEGGATGYGTAIATQSTSSGGTSGTAGIDISKAGVKTLLIYIRNVEEITPATDIVYSVNNIKVYGVAGVTNLTTSNIVTDLLGRIDAAYLPAGWERYIASEATVVEPFAPGVGSISDYLEDVRRYSGYSLGWYMTPTGTGTLALPHFYPRDTEPRYIIDLDDCPTEPDVSAGDIDDLYSAVNVAYATPGGANATVTVYDDDPSHYLVRAGLNVPGNARYYDLSATGTTSAALAARLGELALATLGRDRITGSVPVDRLRTVRGATVPVSSARPGHMARVLGAPGGAYDVPIEEISFGGGPASLTFGADYRLETELARLQVRRQER